MGRAVAAGGGEVAGTLVAPAVVQWIFRYRQQLHKVVAHAFDVGGQLAGQLTVAQGRAVLVTPPRAQVYLVNQQRAVYRRLGRAFLPPRSIMPVVAADVVDLAVRAGAGGRVEGVGVGLPHRAPVRAGDDVLIAVIDFGIGLGQLPHAAVQPRHGGALPAVEVSGQRHGTGMGRPHAEDIARLRRVRAEVSIRAAARQQLRHGSRSFSLSTVSHVPRRNRRNSPS